MGGLANPMAAKTSPNLRLPAPLAAPAAPSGGGMDVSALIAQLTGQGGGVAPGPDKTGSGRVTANGHGTAGRDVNAVNWDQYAKDNPRANVQGLKESFASGGFTPPASYLGGSGAGASAGAAGSGTGFGAAGAGAGAAGAGGAPGGAGTANVAQYQPDLQYAIANMKSRFEGDGGAGRAIDVAGGKLREFSEGERRAAAGRRSMRGVSGTGVDDYDERNIRDNFQNRLAGTATDITLGREAAKDSMLSNIAGAGASSAAIAQADRRGALEEWSAVSSNQRAAEAAQQAQLMNILHLLL